DEADLRGLDRTLAGRAGELADRFRHTEKAAGTTGLAGRKLAAARVVRKRAVVRQRLAAHEGGALAFLAETESFEMQHHDDRIVVVALHEVDAVGADAGLRIEIVAVH